MSAFERILHERLPSYIAAAYIQNFFFFALNPDTGYLSKYSTNKISPIAKLMKILRTKSMRFMLSLMLFAMAAFIDSSCSKDSDTFSSENTQTSNNESAQESNSDEVDDLASVALNTQFAASGGRIEAVGDDRLNCDGTTIVKSDGSTASSGTVTITFGPNGCTDGRGNVRKGSIVVAWQGGSWYKPGSTVVITLTNYSINGLGISGTRTLTCTGATGSLTDFTITWTIVAEHTFTWTDGTAARTVNKTKAWHHTATEDTYTISNGPAGAGPAGIAAAGTNRHGKAYTMSITSPLVYLASCVKSNKVFLPVSGTKVLTVTDGTKSAILTVDFGTGTCDNTYTVSVAGQSKTLTAKNDSSGD